jgi:addiction module RelE/StbE family toxin
VIVKWTACAIKHLYSLHAYIQERNAPGADEVVNKVTSAVEWLSQNTKAGRPGRIVGTREWVVRQTPYIVAYDVTSTTLRILAVMHGAQQWPKTLKEEEQESIHEGIP